MMESDRNNGGEEQQAYHEGTDLRSRLANLGRRMLGMNGGPETAGAEDYSQPAEIQPPVIEAESSNPDFGYYKGVKHAVIPGEDGRGDTVIYNTENVVTGRQGNQGAKIELTLDRRGDHRSTSIHITRGDGWVLKREDDEVIPRIVNLSEPKKGQTEQPSHDADGTGINRRINPEGSGQ